MGLVHDVRYFVLFHIWIVIMHETSPDNTMRLLFFSLIFELEVGGTTYNKVGRQ